VNRSIAHASELFASSPVWQLFSAEEQKVKTATAHDALTLWRSRRGSTPDVRASA